MYLKNGKAVSRVLVADDDPVIRHWVTSILEGEGYNVVSMNDGRDAFRILQSDADFCGAVFDMSMPYLKGTDLIRFMRTEKRLMRIPVMLITAESDIKLVASGFAAGATILLPKPFTRQRLQQMLRMMLGTPEVSKPTSLPTSTRKDFTSGLEADSAIASPAAESREIRPVVQGPVDLSLLASLEDDAETVDSGLVMN